VSATIRASRRSAPLTGRIAPSSTPSREMYVSYTPRADRRGPGPPWMATLGDSAAVAQLVEHFTRKGIRVDAAGATSRWIQRRLQRFWLLPRTWPNSRLRSIPPSLATACSMSAVWDGVGREAARGGVRGRRRRARLPRGRLGHAPVGRAIPRRVARCGWPLRGPARLSPSSSSESPPLRGTARGADLVPRSRTRNPACRIKTGQTTMTTGSRASLQRCRGSVDEGGALRAARRTHVRVPLPSPRVRRVEQARQRHPTVARSVCSMNRRRRSFNTATCRSSVAPRGRASHPAANRGARGVSAALGRLFRILDVEQRLVVVRRKCRFGCDLARLH
jgi:hypothetical protein